MLVGRLDVAILSDLDQKHYQGSHDAHAPEK